jgi:hypothetical protein
LLSVRRIPDHRFLALFGKAEKGKADSFTHGRLPADGTSLDQKIQINV